jgi:hypothetical protein
MSEFVEEALNLFPDGILFGSFLMGITTISAPHIIFFISIIFSLFVLYGIQNITQFIFGGSVLTNPCKPIWLKYTFEQLFVSPSANAPSYSMYIVSFACSYLALSLFNLKDELEVLDTSVMKQYYISMTSLTVLAILYLLYVLLRKCNSIGASTAGFAFGFIIASIIVHINVMLFDKESINFLGIPLLRNKTVDGKAIYICSK